MPKITGSMVVGVAAILIGLWLITQGTRKVGF